MIGKLSDGEGWLVDKVNVFVSVASKLKVLVLDMVSSLGVDVIVMPRVSENVWEMVSDPEPLFDSVP